MKHDLKTQRGAFPTYHRPAERPDIFPKRVSASMFCYFIQTVCIKKSLPSIVNVLKVVMEASVRQNLSKTSPIKSLLVKSRISVILNASMLYFLSFIITCRDIIAQIKKKE